MTSGKLQIFLSQERPLPTHTNTQHTHTCMHKPCAHFYTSKTSILNESVHPGIVTMPYTDTHTFLPPAQTALQSVKLIIMIMQ